MDESTSDYLEELIIYQHFNHLNKAASPGEAADLLVGEGEPGGPQGPEGAADRGQEEALVPDVQGAPLGQGTMAS